MMLEAISYHEINKTGLASQLTKLAHVKRKTRHGTRSQHVTGKVPPYLKA